MRTGEEFMAKFTNGCSRRTVLKGSAALGGAIAAPTFFMRHAFDADFRNNPGSNASVPFGFNVPQTGPYADEGADELRAYHLAVKHINGEGDGRMLNTMKQQQLNGNGHPEEKLTHVNGDTQPKRSEKRTEGKKS